MATSTSGPVELLLLLLLLLLLPLMASASRFRTALLTQNLEDSSPSPLFPANFFFGTSSSSYQYEGAYLTDGKGLSNWDVYTHQPGHVLDGSNGDVAADQYHLYQEDADLLASLGVNSHKLSISWSRVLPKGRHGNINWKGINYYKNLIDSLLLKGIEPFVTINHYDVPQELEDRYQGWLSSEMQEEYAYFADVCFKHLGDKVKYWITFNEPNMWIICAYRWGLWPASHGNWSEGDAAKQPFIVAHNMILAHAAAVNIYRNNYQQQQGGQIGLAVLFYWYEPMTNSTADKAAVERGQSFMSKWFLDPIIYGSYPKEMKDLLGSDLPEFSSNDLEKLKAARLDFIGINHYTTYYVQDCLSSTCDPFMTGNTREEGFVGQSLINQNGNLIGEMTGLEYLAVYPPGMEKVVTYVKENFPNIPLYVTENGYCDTTTPFSNIEEVLNDTKRVKFLADYLDAIATAISKGADVRGYFIWSLFDNFEWTYGYTKRLGLYQFDRVTLKRTPKLSAKWYKQFIAKNQKIENKIRSKNLVLHQNQ
ncbi:PREDICTED: beta-glucosidase 46-like [Ipomoea nil]|uniref:beta-glucosidase 46-like n=1 Tax=Ipomoea nil TaxID=35883 RepID=UPI000901EA2F|nr:PREDICTED: beta-glucosidase 46-like [Ipomoea nil]